MLGRTCVQYHTWTRGIGDVLRKWVPSLVNKWPFFKWYFWLYLSPLSSFGKCPKIKHMFAEISLNRRNCFWSTLSIHCPIVGQNWVNRWVNVHFPSDTSLPENSLHSLPYPRWIYCFASGLSIYVSIVCIILVAYRFCLQHKIITFNFASHNCSKIDPFIS